MNSTIARRIGVEATPHSGMSFAEFVFLIAGLMALNALAIDVMLPALPNIADAFAITDPNEPQKILTAYLIGFGASQLFYGPLSDRFGRKGVLLIGLACYTAAGVASVLTDSFEHLLIARFVQGIGSGAPRVVAVSIVRDCYSGRHMGRVMSLVMMVFMMVPILAPSIGQMILLAAPWHWIFALLIIGGVIMLAWCALRLPETLPPERRSSLAPAAIASAYWQTVANRISLGYMVAFALVLGGLFGFINSAQQVFVDIFGLGQSFTLVFAAIALGLTAASFLNSRLVERFGMRRLSHGALVGFVAVAMIHAGLAFAGVENLTEFIAAQCLMMFLFGFLGPNFNAMAMEPLGRIAGTASSMIGFVTTFGAAILGYLIGQLFDGSIVPLTAGFAGFGLLALIVVYFAEQGRLFRPHEPDPAE